MVRDREVVFLPGVEPPRGEARELHRPAELDELADGVGDLELAAGRRAYLRDRLENRGAEHVDPHQGEVALRLFGLFDQARHLPVGIDLGDAERGRVLHLFQHDRCRDSTSSLGISGPNRG